MSEGQECLRAVAIGLVGDDAYQVDALAERDALRIGDASVAQLNGVRADSPLLVFSLGEHMVMTRPVQAPMVCRSGSATVRPLNIS